MQNLDSIDRIVETIWNSWWSKETAMTQTPVKDYQLKLEWKIRKDEIIII